MRPSSLQLSCLVSITTFTSSSSELWVSWFFLLFQGATIKRHEVTGDIFIARVIHGGLAERSGEPPPGPWTQDPGPPLWSSSNQDPSVPGLLHAGDRILEVNGFSVGGMEPEQVINVVVMITNECY